MDKSDNSDYSVIGQRVVDILKVRFKDSAEDIIKSLLDESLEFEGEEEVYSYKIGDIELRRLSSPKDLPS